MGKGPSSLHFDGELIDLLECIHENCAKTILKKEAARQDLDRSGYRNHTNAAELTLVFSIYAIKDSILRESALLLEPDPHNISSMDVILVLEPPAYEAPETETTKEEKQRMRHRVHQLHFAVGALILLVGLYEVAFRLPSLFVLYLLPFAYEILKVEGHYLLRQRKSKAIVDL
jgi:hypothetical protein